MRWGGNSRPGKLLDKTWRCSSCQASNASVRLHPPRTARRKSIPSPTARAPEEANTGIRRGANSTKLYPPVISLLTLMKPVAVISLEAMSVPLSYRHPSFFSSPPPRWISLSQQWTERVVSLPGIPAENPTGRSASWKKPCGCWGGLDVGAMGGGGRNDDDEEEDKEAEITQTSWSCCGLGYMWEHKS